MGTAGQQVSMGNGVRGSRRRGSRRSGGKGDRYGGRGNGKGVKEQVQRGTRQQGVSNSYWWACQLSMCLDQALLASTGPMVAWQLPTAEEGKGASRLLTHLAELEWS